MEKKMFLTKAEHQVMLYVWDLGNEGGFTIDILVKYEEPKPAYTTLATFLKILTNKGFVNVKKVGSMLYYTPRISKLEYCKSVLEKIDMEYFDGNTVEFIKFLVKHNKLSKEQMDDIIAGVR